MGIFINLLLAYWFAKIGSKRVIGGFTSFCWVLLMWPFGIPFVLASRRLDDDKRNRELIEEYRPVKM